MRNISRLLHYIIVVIIVYRRARIKICMRAGDCWEISTRLSRTGVRSQRVIVMIIFTRRQPDEFRSVVTDPILVPFPLSFSFHCFSSLDGFFVFTCPTVRVSHRETHDVRCSLIAFTIMYTGR